MKRIFILAISLILLCAGAALALPPEPSKPYLDSNCNQAKYYPMGILCQDTDDGKLYKGMGTSVTEITDAVAGGGDVTGPAASSDGELPLFSGAGGKTLKRSNTLSGFPYLTLGVLSALDAATLRTNAGLVIGTNVLAPDGSAASLTNFPTLNQSTTGSAASLKSPATTGLMQATGMGAGTTRIKTVRDANDTLLELGGSYTPTGTWNWGTATVTWPTFNQNTSGNAGTATALASNPTNCSAGQYPLGIDASGNVESCTAAPTQASLHIDDILTALGINSGDTNSGNYSGSTIPDGQTYKAAIQALETAFEALPGGHTQNTDTGTTRTTFLIDSGATGVRVKHNSGALEARNAADDAYAPFQALTINGTTITASVGFSGPLTGAVTGNVTGNADTATTATNVTVADTADTTTWVMLATDATGNVAPKIDGGLTYNAGTGTLTATAFSGPLTGAVTGNVTGNASTATALASDPTDCSANQFANAIAASGNLTCAQPTPANLGAGTLAAAMTVGTGGSIGVSGSGTVNATTLLTATWASPAAIGSSTPAAGTFTTMSAGGGGFTVDADGDVVAKSLTLTRVAGQASYSEYYEILANGNSKITVKGQDSLAADFTLTLPGETGTICSTGSVCTGYQAAITRPVTGPAAPTAGYLTKWNTSGQDIVDGPKIGTFTDSKWCTYSTANGLQCTSDTPAGAGDVTGGTASAAGELAAYTDTGGKAITRSYIVWSGPSTSAKTKTISNANDTIAEYGVANIFTALQTMSAGAAIGNGASGPGFLRFLEDSDNGTDYSLITGAADAGTNPSFTFSGSAAGSEDLSLTATANLWTFASSTSATVAFTPSVALNGGATVGGTLALGANNLTMTGSLAVTGSRVTKGWFTDIESTNMPTVGGTAILSSLTAPVFSTSIEAPFIILGSAATAADAGTIRMPNAGSIMFEADEAGTDINALNVDASEVINIGSAGASSIVLGDNTATVKIRSPINTSNGTWSGHTVYFAQCAASLAFGKAVYVQSTGKPDAADADAIATMPAIGIVVVASTDADTPCTVLTHGVVSATAFPTFTAGGLVYVADGTTSGELTGTIGDLSDENDVVQVIGVALGADTIFVNPSLAVAVLAAP